MDHRTPTNPLFRPWRVAAGVSLALVMDVLVTIVAGNVLDVRTGALCDLGDRFDGPSFFRTWALLAAIAVTFGVLLWRRARRRLSGGVLAVGGLLLPLIALFVVASTCTG